MTDIYLRNYQKRVVDSLIEFFREARARHDKLETIQAMGEEEARDYDWVSGSLRQAGVEPRDNPKNGLGWFYPRVVMKVPTGGGKTLLAVEAIREYQNLYARSRTGLVVWIVPSETIYSQTIGKLRDKSHHLRQLLDQASGNRTVIKEKGERLAAQDIKENLVILFVMIQSISRQNAKEALRVFQDSGGYEEFFPKENRYDLHKELLSQFPNLDSFSTAESIFPLVKTSLGNAVRMSKPFIIIDEIHKVFSEMAQKTIDGLNPEMVLGLSATPKREMNILISISGQELKQEGMVKLDMHVCPPSERKESDWRSMLQEVKTRRDSLERRAGRYHQEKGVYIRPIALLQAEATGNDQRGKGRVHSLDVRDELIKLKVHPEEVAIKTSAQNDIEDVDLFSPDCRVRYIITKEALREGWDCSFAYVLGIIPNVNSDTSITQLVGRILRQPYAVKTGVAELDESYVYYSRGETLQMLERVEAGFRNEGLEELIGGVKVESREEYHPTKVVKIRKEFKKDSDGALYLPVWVMLEGKDDRRRFSYDLHIRPHLNSLHFDLTEKAVEEIASGFGEVNRERKGMRVTLDETSHFKASLENEQPSVIQGVDLEYLSRRYADIIPNPFQARILALEHLEALKKKLSSRQLSEYYGFVVASLCHKLMETQSLLEENIFMDYLARKRLVLAVSNDPNLGYRIPETEEIQSSGTNLFQYYLFNDVDIASMNELERRVGNLLDRQSSILWWFKNKVKRDGYSIQGWRSNRVYPDFVAAKKDANDKLDIVYIFESKGEHLQGNADTEYKKKVLDIMTDQHRQDAIQMYTQPELPLFKVNDRVECYLIEEGREEHEIRKLFAPTAVQAPVKPAVVGRRRKALKRTMSGRKRKPAG